MATRDIFHEAVKHALVKDGWTITHDPLSLSFGGDYAMAKLDDYRRYVQQVLEQYSQLKPAYGEIERQLIFDPVRDHYQVTIVGWLRQQRVHDCLMHIDLKDDQIWIQHDGTEGGIANDLVALGVPKDDIVLAFHAPYKRPYTGFGVGKEQPGQRAA